MVIEYYRKNVFGKINLYVKNAEQASYILALTRRNTITVKDIWALEKMGHSFKEVLMPNETKAILLNT